MSGSKFTPRSTEERNDFAAGYEIGSRFQADEAARVAGGHRPTAAPCAGFSAAAAAGWVAGNASTTALLTRWLTGNPTGDGWTRDELAALAAAAITDPRIDAAEVADALDAHFPAPLYDDAGDLTDAEFAAYMDGAYLSAQVA